jgi:hypothetical protein
MWTSVNAQARSGFERNVPIVFDAHGKIGALPPSHLQNCANAIYYWPALRRS